MNVNEVVVAEKQKSAQKKQRGATMVEYALMVALIAVVCVGAVAVLGGNVLNTFDQINTQF